MFAQINSPLFLLALLPPLTLLGTFFLIRWASGSAHNSERPSLSMTLAVLLCILLSMGRPQWPLPYGLNALFYGICLWGIFGLIQSWWVSNIWARRGATALASIAFSALICTPLLLQPIWGTPLFSVVILCLLCLFTTLRPCWEMQTFEDRISPFLVLTIMGAFLTLLCYLGDAHLNLTLSFSLSILGISGILFGYTKRWGQLSDLATTPLSLCMSVVTWDLWAQQGIPLICLISLPLTLFAKSAALRLVEASPGWAVRFYYPLLILLASLPGLITLVSFDVFRNL